MRRRRKPRMYGLLAEFDRPEALVDAARQVRAAGYRRFDAYTPFPIVALMEAMELREAHLPVLALFVGLAVAALALFGQWYVNVIDYPLNVGGRPLASWPSFLMPALQVGLLFATVSAVIGMLVLNRLPRYRHPLFRVEHFRRFSEDRFFLCIESRDALFDPAATRRLLEDLGAVSVTEVPR
jgi:hypothetical protein